MITPEARHRCLAFFYGLTHKEWAMHHDATIVIPIEFFDGNGNVWHSRMFRDIQLTIEPFLGLTIVLYPNDKSLDGWVGDYQFANVLPAKDAELQVAKVVVVQDVKLYRFEKEQPELELVCEPLRCWVTNQEEAEGRFHVLKSGYSETSGWQNNTDAQLEHDEVAGYDDSDDDDDEEGEGDVSDLPPPYEDPPGSSHRQEHCSFFGSEHPLWARN